ncbi:MAG: hypothetical protein EOO78_32215 [Oxalobacteraceae bacterium]|nr:MAG: hypothetical protein EOO78_32215 [Oxalobacteraceae bacterium]
MVGQRRGQNRHGRILAVRFAARRAAAILAVRGRHGTADGHRPRRGHRWLPAGKTGPFRLLAAAPHVLPGRAVLPIDLLRHRRRSVHHASLFGRYRRGSDFRPSRPDPPTTGPRTTGTS